MYSKLIEPLLLLSGGCFVPHRFASSSANCDEFELVCQHLFESFSRVDSSDGRTTEGVGLGLSIAKTIVQLRGGTIEVVSELGKGAEFTIRLPLPDKGSAANVSQADV